MSNSDFKLTFLRGGEEFVTFAQIAVLHTGLIHGGVLPLLGEDFLAHLYREIARSKYGSVHIAVDGNRVIGFVAGTSDLWRCTWSFTPRGYGCLLWRLLLRCCRPQLLRKILAALVYPLRQSTATPMVNVQSDKHRAELLAIAVSSSTQTQGIGRALVLALERTLREHGVARYYVATNVQEASANAFYRALGFAEAGRQPHHDLVIQLYTKKLDCNNLPDNKS